MEENKMIKQTRHGWVDLSNLSRNKNGTVNWKNSIGCTIPFKYEDLHTYLTIDKFIRGKTVSISIPSYISNHIIDTNNIMSGKFGAIIGKITPNFRYAVGDVINNNIVITECYKHNNLKYYRYTCLHDNYNGTISEGCIKRGKGCPICFGNRILRGHNDIATVRPDIVDLLWNHDDAYVYGANSHKKIDFKCTRCGEKINSRIDNVCNQGLCCKKCSDGLSYPSKFVYNFLQQLVSSDVLYTEKSFEWSQDILHANSKISGNKKYDFYISYSSPIIIEAHGSQHFYDSFVRIGNNARSCEEEQENDRIKMNIAIQNGIASDCYIQLDCKESNIKYIKNSIMSSNLPYLLNFTEDQIDWVECDRFAISSRVYEACALWNNGMHTIKDIANKMKLHRDTIRSYLRRGEELGIVQDPPKRIKKKTQQND